MDFTPKCEGWFSQVILLSACPPRDAILQEWGCSPKGSDELTGHAVGVRGMMWFPDAHLRLGLTSHFRFNEFSSSWCFPDLVTELLPNVKRQA